VQNHGDNRLHLDGDRVMGGFVSDTVRITKMRHKLLILDAAFHYRCPSFAQVIQRSGVNYTRGQDAVNALVEDGLIEQVDGVVVLTPIGFKAYRAWIRFTKLISGRDEDES